MTKLTTKARSASACLREIAEQADALHSITGRFGARASDYCRLGQVIDQAGSAAFDDDSLDNLAVLLNDARVQLYRMERDLAQRLGFEAA